MLDEEKLFSIFPELETERLLLRQIRPADATAVFDLFGNPSVTRYYDQPTFTDIGEARALIARMRQRFADRRTLRWAITLPNGRGDTVVGTCGYADWKRHFRCAAVGYELNEDYWRQGIMREALGAVLAFGYEAMALNRIEAYVMRGNEPSLALLRGLGFLEEGLLRQFGYWKDSFHDLHLLSLLKKDYVNNEQD